MELILRVLKLSLISGAVTALATALGPLFERRLTPRWRYWLWLVLAAALLLAPVSPEALFPELPEPAVTVRAPEVRVGLPEALRPAQGTVGEPASPDDSGVPAAPGNPVTPSDPVTPAEPAAPDASDTAEGAGTVELSAILTAVWLTGAAVFTLWHILGAALLSYRLRRWSVPAGGGISSLCGELARELGLRRAPRVGVSRGLASPMAVGLFRPCLWLPDRAWEERELNFILRHELTHIKRRDLWYKALILLSNALHWFNPLVWLMRRQASETVELLCDAQALRGADEETRRAYCETLLENICRVPGSALTTHFYGGKRSVKIRFRNLFSGNNRRFGWAALICCVLIAGVTACAVGVGSSKSIPPDEFGGEFTAQGFKYVSIRDENGDPVADGAALIGSLDELEKLREDNNIDPVDDGDLAAKLDTYSKDYFRENVLIVLFVQMGSGSFELSVENVTPDGDAMKVTLEASNPTAPDAAMDMCQWCVLVECKRVEGVTSARWELAKSDTEPDPAEPDPTEPDSTEDPGDAPLPERVLEKLKTDEDSVVKVNWHGEESVFSVEDEYDLNVKLAALSELTFTPSERTGLEEGEMSVLIVSADGLCGVRLGKSGGPVELIYDGASTFWDIPQDQRDSLWSSFYSEAQSAAHSAFTSGITADGSLTVDEAAAEIAEKMAQAVRTLPEWVEWKPVDFQLLECEVINAYFGEPQNFCASVTFAIDFGPDGMEDPKYVYGWTAGSSPRGPYTGELEGYYGWHRLAYIFLNDAGQWELMYLATGEGLIYIPEWTYTSDVEKSIENAPVEELLRIFHLSRGMTHDVVAMNLCWKSPEELSDFASALTSLTVDEARELHDSVLRHIEKLDSGSPSPSDTLILEALEDYIGE